MANGQWQGAGGLADGVPWAGSAATTINRADSERLGKLKAEPWSVEETAWSRAVVGVQCWGAQWHVLDDNVAPVGLWQSQDAGQGLPSRHQAMAGAQVGLPGPFPEPPAGPCPVSDSDSDSEDATAGDTGSGTGAQNPSQVIHSGHFMVSSPHSDSLPRRRHHRTELEPADPRSIDPTLTRLFECMSLEYR